MFPTTGSSVSRKADGRRGEVVRVIASDGALGGLVEVRWDGQRLSRSAGFEPVSGLVVEATGLRHKDGLVVFA